MSVVKVAKRESRIGVNRSVTSVCLAFGYEHKFFFCATSGRPKHTVGLTVMRRYKATYVCVKNMIYDIAGRGASRVVWGFCNPIFELPLSKTP